MKRLLHLPELQFSKLNPPALRALERFIEEQRPSLDCLVVTGDWMIRRPQDRYRAVAELIKQTQLPVITMPRTYSTKTGRFLARLVSPLRRYSDFFKTITVDVYESSELCVVAFKTANQVAIVEEFFLEEDLKKAEAVFNRHPKALRVLACRHPIFQPKALSELRPRDLARRLLDLKPHVILSGHRHLHWIEVVSTGQGHEILHLSVGRAISESLQSEVSSFHLIDLVDGRIRVETFLIEEDGWIGKVNSVEHEVMSLNLKLSEI